MVNEVLTVTDMKIRVESNVENSRCYKIEAVSMI